jgi:hypothetical protein
MTPTEFIAKWQPGGSADALNERAGAQAHFIDLCELLGQPKPADPENYCFERGAQRTGGNHGWADVWKRDCFAWEYKAPGADLGKALKQLMTYALALDNPPLLVVSDRRLIQIHTHFTGTPSEVHTIRIEDIGTPENQQKLQWLFESPERFRPSRDNRQITDEAARAFAELATRLRTKHPGSEGEQQVAHFLTQCLFCLFAEDAELLPRGLFERLLDKSKADGQKLDSRLRELFAAMQKGGDFALEDIAYFNGGLFEVIDPLPLDTDEAAILHAASKLDWNAIDPAIFGTLFERGLDPKKRSQLGAHYTDPATIMRLIDPVIVRPVAAEWEAAKAEIAASMAKSKKVGDKAYKDAQARFVAHLERLKNYRVLDAACGSGNFLYLALKALKDLEHKANLDAEALGLQRQVSIEVSPANVLGIELNEYAAELARVTVWIGELQWMRTHGYPVRRNPILARLDHVEHRDALLNADGSETEWPACDAIVGNPPFLGDKVMRGELGSDYTDRLRKRYEGRVPGGADLVTYWFEKARAQIAAGQCTAAGLVSTNSIRGGANRKVLERIAESGRIFEAWSDEAWVNDGAAVRVSLVCFGGPNAPAGALDGIPTEIIHADVTAGDGLNLSAATPLAENDKGAVQGITKGGKFDIPGKIARQWLVQPNPNGRPNSDVVRPWLNGEDVTQRGADNWIVDFADMSADSAMLYEQPFAHVQSEVKPSRDTVLRERRRKYWWQFNEIAPGMRRSVFGLPRFIVTPETPTHTVFSWAPTGIVPDKNLIVIPRSDDVTFGVLCTRFHLLWVRALGSPYGNHPTARRYNSSRVFLTFPFPPGMTPRDTKDGPPTGPQAEAIAAAAQRLNELRENWLNPPEWVERVPEVVPGFPDRIVAKPEHAAELKKRTLTNLYNQRPAWLDNTHKALDAAVAAAYGWTDYTPDMPDEEILRRLLALNLERSTVQKA